MTRGANGTAQQRQSAARLCVEVHLLCRYSDLQLEDMAIESMNEERMADMLVGPLFFVVTISFKK